MSHEALLTLARQAGEAILQVYDSTDVGLRQKDDQSPLTAADLAAEAVIQDGLARIVPRLPVLSEESAQAPWSERRTWERCWVVDPLDGTKEFISRSGEFTVNIALVEHGRPLMGVVFAPALARAWWGGRMLGGSWCDGVPLRCAVRDSSRPPRVVASRSHAGRETEDWLAKLGPHTRVAKGSSLKICMIAEGSADLYPRLGPTMAWDTAAAHAVLVGAGGRMCDHSGQELTYHRDDLRNPWFIAKAPGWDDLPALE
jgi:3'(2'), 5'-bisphosphate nucleotidase